MAVARILNIVLANGLCVDLNDLACHHSTVNRNNIPIIANTNSAKFLPIKIFSFKNDTLFMLLKKFSQPKKIFLTIYFASTKVLARKNIHAKQVKEKVTPICHNF